MSSLERDPLEDAEANGLVCVLPDSHELFIDADDAASLGTLADMLEVLEHNGVYVECVKQTRSKSGNAHVYLRFPGRLTPLERVALQSCLGSDRKRELLSFLRVRRGNAFPTVFFEVPEPDSTTGYVPDWDAAHNEDDVPF